MMDEKVESQESEYSLLYKEFRDLKKRIRTTRHSRIEASKRLRKKITIMRK